MKRKAHGLLLAATLGMVLADTGRSLPPQQAPEWVSLPTGGSLLRWQGHAGRSYFLQISDPSRPLEKWLWVPVVKAGVDTEISHDLGEATEAKRFFRIVHTDQVPEDGETVETADFDGDGISNIDEVNPPAELADRSASVAGKAPPAPSPSATNPLDADTDSDGLSDGWERAHGIDPNDDGSGDPRNGPNGLFQGGPTTNGEAFDQGVQADPNATIEDTDADGRNNPQDAVPDDGEINWPRSPEARYVWLPQVEQTGASAVSKYGHILFPFYNDGSDNHARSEILWDSATSQHVSLIQNNSWSGSGLQRETRRTETDENGDNIYVFTYTPLTVDSAYSSITNMNDSGTLVGISEIIDDGKWGVAALMKWEMTEATDQYGSPTYHLPSTAYTDDEDDEDEIGRKTIEMALGDDWFYQIPKIADDGTISDIAWNYTLTFPSVWVTVKPQAGQHSNEMSQWANMDWKAASLNTPEDVGAILNSETGLLFDRFGNADGEDQLQYRSNGGAEILEGLQGDVEIGIWSTTTSDIATIPSEEDTTDDRVWFSLDDGSNSIVQIEKRAGGSGVSRWHKPDSLSEGAIRLNARGEAITGTKVWRNATYTLINDLVSKPEGSDLNVNKLIDLASNGIILAEATEAGVTKTGLLVPVNLAVDANRDGEIEFGIDQTTSEKPFRFWINNDQDDVEADEPADVDENSRDLLDNTIKTKRDLEDFTRIRLSVGVPIEHLRDGSWKVGLKFRETGGQNPSIRIWPNESDTGSEAYLTNGTVAGRQIAEQPFGETYSATVFIPASYWTDRTDTEAHLIFEGTKKGVGELILVLKEQGSTAENEAASLHLNLLDVREMFQRARIENSASQIPNPWVDDTPPAQTWAWDPWNWPYDEDPEAEETTAIFVHGWRLTYGEYLNWAQTSYKRLWHQGFKGKFYTFRWATLSADQSGTEGYLTYNPSEYRSWLCGSSLASWVNNLPNAGHRSLFAHSMGNVITGSALRHGMSVQRYALCNAAMASMAYDSGPHMRLDPVTGQPWDKIWGDFGPQKTPDTDTSAAIRDSFGLEGKFNGGSNFPQMINFYLREDEALDAWVDNNRFFKPDSTGHNYYYQHIPQPPNISYKLFQAPPVGNPREVTSPPEAFGYVTKALTRTAGSDSRTGGSIGSSVNMNDWGVGANHSGFGETHSAQWRWSNQSTSHFWDQLCEKLQLTQQE